MTGSCDLIGERREAFSEDEMLELTGERGGGVSQVKRGERSILGRGGNVGKSPVGRGGGEGELRDLTEGLEGKGSLAEKSWEGGRGQNMQGIDSLVTGLIFTLQEMGCHRRVLSNAQIDQICVLRRNPSYPTD